LETGDRLDDRALSGAVGAKEGNGLTRCAFELGVEVELTDAGDDVGGDAHVRLPRNRPRSEMSTVSETASRTRLRAMASSRLTSSAE
jgi:hypothetical protein